MADRLPEEVTARLSYDDVRSLLRWHLEYLRDRGVPIRRDQAAAGGPVVVEDDEGVAFVLGRADAGGLDVTDTEVARCSTPSSRTSRPSAPSAARYLI